MPNVIKPKDVAVAIAALNEEKVIGTTLACLLNQVNRTQIYIVNDGSTDKTAQIAQNFSVNIANNAKPSGKVCALEKLIAHFDLLNRYRAILFLDADTLLAPDFITNALLKLNKPRVSAVAGKVRTAAARGNLFVCYRSFSYALWQDFYKKIAGWFGAIWIAPGTSSIYRTQALKRITFDTKMIIEDFDLTFQIHRKRLGRIAYVEKAQVLTQDPDNLTDYFKQMKRWQIGLLQAIVKHKVPFGFQAFDLAVAFLFLQGLVHMTSLILFPLAILASTYWQTLASVLPPTKMAGLIIVDVWFIVGSAFYFGIKEKKRFYFLYALLFWVLQYVNIACFWAALKKMLTPKGNSGAWISPSRHSLILET